MADWKKIRESVGRAAEKAIQKTGEVADMASMHVKLKSYEAKRNAKYQELGKLTYRQLKSGESQAEKIAPVVESLDELAEKIRAMIAEIEEAKREREAKRAEEAAEREAAKAKEEKEEEKDDDSES